MKNSRIYCLINSLFILFSIGLWFSYAKKTVTIFNHKHIELREIFVLLSIMLFLLILVQSVKALRLYFVFLDCKISWTRFIRQYVKATFVGVILPFKLGDFFRMYCFSHTIKNMRKGILGIVIERYLDSIILLLMLLSCQFMMGQKISMITVIVSIFLVFITFLYVLVSTSFEALNHCIIVKNQGHSGIVFLKALDKLKNAQLEIKKMTEHRVSIILFLSATAWTIEYFMIRYLYEILEGKFEVINFTEYLANSFFGGESYFKISYLSISGGIIGLLFLVVLIKDIKGENNEKSYYNL